MELAMHDCCLREYYLHNITLTVELSSQRNLLCQFPDVSQYKYKLNVTVVSYLKYNGVNPNKKATKL